MRKSKWETQAGYANATLKDVKSAFSRAGLYVTSLLLSEVIRVAEYETATEIARHKQYRKKRTKR